ncbi:MULTISPECIES: M28 family peptidase [unclassified Leptolyngbya]|uniref:M28 family peptidase n=1 Tax=unclassified Leptolyngbya TaxID=2650499 RepID=UPI001684C9D0|nr:MULTISPECIES: M28 family peptidase [unclassified Leptolyngbya]MBD1910568.1 M28 family peptidase [Leptolyngbya sp. FACHB-8]MBD2153939.1 M28 family peptidase [Leptolyngbya sp. FACHB-16]
MSDLSPSNSPNFGENVNLPDPQGLKDNLLSHLKEIVRDRDPYFSATGHLYVREYMREQLAQWGTVETHSFQHHGQEHQNLVLNLSASKPEAATRPPILIGAHYDAVPNCPGADDNGTGAVALLELARFFAAFPARSPLRFVAFDLEEYGLLGSAAYAQMIRQQGQSLRLMLSLEMLGYCTQTPNSQTYPPGLQYFYPNRGNFIALVGNWKTIPDLMRLSRTLRRSGPVPCEWLPAGDRGLQIRSTRLSDHAPFWDQGYRAVMVTDTAFLRNPHYHKASDRIDTLDLDFLTGACRGLMKGLQAL